MIIKEYNEDGSVKSEFNGSQYEYERWSEKKEKSNTTTVNRPKVVIQENVEKVTKYDVKNVKFEKSDVKDAFKNNPEKLQNILKNRLEDGGLSIGDIDLNYDEVKEIFKKDPQKLQDIIIDGLECNGRVYAEFTERDIKDIFKDNPEKLQTLLSKMEDTANLKAQTAKIKTEKGRALSKGLAVGVTIAVASVGIAGGITILVKNDVIPKPNDWLKKSN